MPTDNASSHTSTIYDEQVRKTIPYYDAFHRETLNLVQTMGRQPGCWLDTGCGTGTLVELAMPLFPETTFLLADPSPEMLALAQRKCAAVPKSKVDIIGALGTQQISPEYFGHADVVTAIQCHHYLTAEERAQATQTCYHLLAPGGVYITFENIRPFTSEGIAIGKANWGHFQRADGKTAEAVEAHLQRFDVEYFPITVAEHLDLLRACGFRVVELLWYSYVQAGFYAVK